MLQNFITSDDPLNLDNIRSTLIRLEDTIIFGEFPFHVIVLQKSLPFSHVGRGYMEYLECRMIGFISVNHGINRRMFELFWERFN